MSDSTNNEEKNVDTANNQANDNNLTQEADSANKNKKIFIIEAIIAVIAIVAIIIAIVISGKSGGANSKELHTISFDEACPNETEEKTSISVNTTYGSVPVVPNYIAMNPITEEEATAKAEAGELIKLETKDGSYVYVANYKADDFKDKIKVSDADIDEFINQNITAQFKEQTPIEGRDDVRDGDVINIDYVGSIDGVEFEGGTGNYDLAIGSHSFIDTFEEQLIGAKVGDTVSVNVTFPTPYPNNPDLSGKPALFVVSVNKLLYTETIPDLTDDMVKEFFTYEGMNDITTIAQCKEFFRDYLASSLIDQTISSSFYVSSVSADMIVAFYNDNMSLYELMAQQYQTNLQDLLSQNGTSMEEFKKSCLEDATSQALYYQCMCAIADDLGITVTDEDTQNFIKLQGCETAEEIKKLYGKEYSLQYHVIQYLVSKALTSN